MIETSRSKGGAINAYLAGSLIRVATYTGTLIAPVGGFQDINGVVTDPTTVVLKVLDPTGASTTPVITKDGAGLYHCDLDTTGKPGLWTYQWIGTGAVQAIAASQFRVAQAPL